MHSEIVFTGLCSILNPDGKNKEMNCDPAVILVQTDDHHATHRHIAYLAFDADEVEVTGAAKLEDVPKTGQRKFKYLAVDGWELVIKDNTAGPPAVDTTYSHLVAHKDDYWPEVKDVWDRDYVPEVGYRPTNAAVKAWLRFGKGKLSASRISEVPWRFTHASGATLEKNFAEEVVYSEFSHPADEVVIELKELESGNDAGELTFRLKTGLTKLTLIIGNSLEDDLAPAVLRTPTKRALEPYADHFKYLNRVTAGTGPVPVVINPLADKANTGGGSGGACGPGSGNGRP